MAPSKLVGSTWLVASLPCPLDVISLDEGLYYVILLVEKFKRVIDLRSNRATKRSIMEMVDVISLDLLF